MPKETNKKQSKDKKHFAKDFKAELKRVIWPTPKQLFNNTVAVITIVLITAIMVFVLDVAFETMNKHGIEKIKTVVESRETTNDTNSIEQEQSNQENSTNSAATNSTSTNEVSTNLVNTNEVSTNSVKE